MLEERSGIDWICLQVRHSRESLFELTQSRYHQWKEIWTKQAQVVDKRKIWSNVMTASHEVPCVWPAQCSNFPSFNLVWLR